MSYNYTNKVIWEKYGMYDYSVILYFNQESIEYAKIGYSAVGIFTYSSSERMNLASDGNQIIENQPIKFEVLSYPIDECIKNYAMYEGIIPSSISNIFCNEEVLNLVKKDINLPKRMPFPFNLELEYSEDDEDTSNLRLY